MKLRLMTLVALAAVATAAIVSSHVPSTPDDFLQACKDTRVRFYKPPSAPVTSVLWQQEPEQARRVSYHGYVIASNKKLIASGTILDGWQPFLLDYVPVYSPLEKTYEQSKAGLPASGFFKRYRRELGSDPGPASFDVKVTYTIGPESSLTSVGDFMPMAKHSLEVTDLRTNERLAEMVYVIDRARSLACGENIPGQANMDVFVLQATNLIQNVVQPPGYMKPWVAPKTQYEP